MRVRGKHADELHSDEDAADRSSSEFMKRGKGQKDEIGESGHLSGIVPESETDESYERH
jgi:hypothetical protein